MAIRGYKGFDSNLKCRDFQYEVGKEYEEKEAIACEKGFHFCENPLDVFRYYSPAKSRFAEVEGGGTTDKHNDDSKVACTKIKISTEIGLKGLIEAGMKFMFERVKWGEKDTPQTHGDSSAAQTHGNSSAAQTHGYSSAAECTGQESIAVSTGIEGRAKGKKSCWLVLAEWKQGKAGEWHIKGVKSALVDGKAIKEDTWYVLKGGKFTKWKK